MPHIIILEKHKNSFQRMFDQSEAIQKNIDEGVWANDPEKHAYGVLLQQQAETLCNSIESTYGAGITDLLDSQKEILE